MSVIPISEPCIVHATSGRVRLRCPGLSVRNQRALESGLRRLTGVDSAQANPDTGSVLVRFSTMQTNSRQVLEAVRALSRSLSPDDSFPVPDPVPAPPPAVQERADGTRRARIAVRGLDRDPATARRVVERLERIPGVCATASALTGRVLVEWSSHQTDIEDLISEVADVELPALPGEDRPTHPLDPAPLTQSATRLIGSGLGLSFLAARRLMDQPQATVTGPALSYAGAVLGVAQSFPPVRKGLTTLVGRDVAALMLSLPDIVLSAMTGGPLSLALSAATSLRLLTEVFARRAAWRRYEERLTNTASAQPGQTIRVESGERTPLAARVIEGYGTTAGADGLPLPIMPEATVQAGARLTGGAVCSGAVKWSCLGAYPACCAAGTECLRPLSERD